MEEKLLLFRLEEAIIVKGEHIKAFLHEAFTGCEVGWMGWKRSEREEGINRDLVYISEVLRECGGDRSDLVGDLLVGKSESGGIRR